MRIVYNISCVNTCYSERCSMFGFNHLSIAEILYTLCAVVLALSFHEACHGFVASKLGDPTARLSGRLTLNPLKHIDPLGLICMVLFRFGWAKPVPVNPRWFKKPKQGMAITAAAGPLGNLFLGFVCIFLYYILYLYLSSFAFFSALADFISVLAILNINFAIFNLIPLPPLDGSRILGLFLPSQVYFKIMQYERYIQYALLILLWLGILTTPLNTLRAAVIHGMESVVRWILL